MLDVLATMLVIRDTDHEYRAFKYLYFHYIKTYCKQESSTDEKLMAWDILQKGLRVENDIDLEKRIKEFMENKQIGLYWYCPEYKNPSDVFNKLTAQNSGLVDIYKMYSGPVHSGNIGISLHLDEPDKIDIKPRSNPKSARLAVLQSCRLLLETNLLRNEFEKLGLREIYYKLLGYLHDCTSSSVSPKKVSSGGSVK